MSVMLMNCRALAGIMLSIRNRHVRYVNYQLLRISGPSLNVDSVVHVGSLVRSSKSRLAAR